MKFINIKFVLVLLVLLIIIGLLGYSFYQNFNYNYNYNYNYKVQEKFEEIATQMPNIVMNNSVLFNPDKTAVLNKLNDYSNIMSKDAPEKVNSIQDNISTIIPEITSKQDYLENLAKTNLNDLKIINYSLQTDINKINKLMNGSTILPINKNIKEGFNGTPQFPIPTSLKVFEKFENTNDWRTEWNNKLASIYNKSSTNQSLKDMEPVVNTDRTEFYILKNPKLEENLNNISSKIIKNNLDNISNKLKSQWLKNKF